MIKISHINGDEKVVTRGAFESIFKPLGYKPVAEKEIKEIKNDLTGNKEKEIKSSEKEESKFSEKVENKDKRK